jgi:hypothetical protein
MLTRCIASGKCALISRPPLLATLLEFQLILKNKFKYKSCIDFNLKHGFGDWTVNRILNLGTRIRWKPCGIAV